MGRHARRHATRPVNWLVRGAVALAVAIGGLLPGRSVAAEPVEVDDAVAEPVDEPPDPIEPPVDEPDALNHGGRSQVWSTAAEVVDESRELLIEIGRDVEAERDRAAHEHPEGSA